MKRCTLCEGSGYEKNINPTVCKNCNNTICYYCEDNKLEKSLYKTCTKCFGNGEYELKN